MIRPILKILGIILLVVAITTIIYTNSLIGVNEVPKKYLIELKEVLNEDGWRSSIFVISGKRWPLDNWLLTKISGASSNSQHLAGNAIDIIVLYPKRNGLSRSHSPLHSSTAL